MNLFIVTLIQWTNELMDNYPDGPINRSFKAPLSLEQIFYHHQL
jgi:hypothetical protein